MGIGEERTTSGAGEGGPTRVREEERPRLGVEEEEEDEANAVRRGRPPASLEKAGARTTVASAGTAVHTAVVAAACAPSPLRRCDEGVRRRPSRGERCPCCCCDERDEVVDERRSAPELGGPLGPGWSGAGDDDDEMERRRRRCMCGAWSGRRQGRGRFGGVATAARRGRGSVGRRRERQPVWPARALRSVDAHPGGVAAGHRGKEVSCRSTRPAAAGQAHLADDVDGRRLALARSSGYRAADLCAVAATLE